MIVATALVAVSLSGVTAPASATPDHFVPPNGPAFNNPYGKPGEVRRLIRHVNRTIDSVPRGGQIRISAWNVRSGRDHQRPDPRQQPQRQRAGRDGPGQLEPGEPQRRRRPALGGAQGRQQGPPDVEEELPASLHQLLPRQVRHPALQVLPLQQGAHQEEQAGQDGPLGDHVRLLQRHRARCHDPVERPLHGQGTTRPRYKNFLGVFNEMVQGQAASQQGYVGLRRRRHRHRVLPLHR